MLKVINLIRSTEWKEVYIHEICRLVFHNDKTKTFHSKYTHEWSHGWLILTDRCTLKKTFFKNISLDPHSAIILRSGSFSKLKWYKQPAFIAISEGDVGEKEAHSLGGGCAFSPGLATYWLWGFSQITPSHTHTHTHLTINLAKTVRAPQSFHVMVQIKIGKTPSRVPST